ncbi:uncharacterized protein FOMMEDRAFT_25912 [Fomitiporia mediterranea MF3/22]|uniref:uncharacterized protein n=1 Tax=Fomitiporia mediterranea (strain MF3/22) TaxID=694068 RepID=UPI000440984D|nr:uncharacterized protein FOMMEDRAFT_25912 [Fomitiporia mediterranea MF3/22]EJD06702.1 hypothetical protein FOMMEDRAFT_25912 [Fomitiporia mediterranea MF3/22]
MSALHLQRETPIESVAEDVMILRYFTVAALALSVYEYLITIKGEVDLIWPSRFTLPIALFFCKPLPSIVAAAVTTYYLLVNVSGDNYGVGAFSINLAHSGCLFLFFYPDEWIAYLILISTVTRSTDRVSGSLGIHLKTMLTGGIISLLCVICMAFANMMLVLYKEVPLSLILMVYDIVIPSCTGNLAVLAMLNPKFQLTRHSLLRSKQSPSLATLRGQI